MQTHAINRALVLNAIPKSADVAHVAESVIEIEESLFSADECAREGDAGQRYTAAALVKTIPEAFREFGDRLFTMLTNGRIRLPVLPDYAARALRVANDPDASFRDYERTIRPNAVMVTKLLRIANSPFYGASSEITSIRQAMLQLGTTTLGQMVMQVVVESHALSDATNLKLAAREQEHALAMAHLCQVVAEELGTATQDAFLAGLIHDLGRVVVPAALNKASITVEDERQLELVEALHPAIGARATHAWKLPSLVQEAVLRHHDYTAAGNFPTYSAIGNLVAAAELLAHHFSLAGNEIATPTTTPLAEREVWRDLSLSPDRVERIVTTAQAMAERLAGRDADTDA